MVSHKFPLAGMLNRNLQMPIANEKCNIFPNFLRWLIELFSCLQPDKEFGLPSCNLGYADQIFHLILEHAFPSTLVLSDTIIK